MIPNRAQLGQPMVLSLSLSLFMPTNQNASSYTFQKVKLAEKLIFPSVQNR